MRVFIFFIAILFLPQVAESQQDKDPAEVLRTSVMQLFTGLDSTRFDAYNALFITKQEMLMMIDKMERDEAEKEEFREEIQNESFEDNNKEEFYALLAAGVELGLDWDDITYDDFYYELITQEGFELLSGSLFFRQGEQLYDIYLEAVEIDGVFRIGLMENLSYTDESYDED